jgi:hypothetical protein
LQVFDTQHGLFPMNWRLTIDKTVHLQDSGHDACIVAAFAHG